MATLNQGLSVLLQQINTVVRTLPLNRIMVDKITITPNKKSQDDHFIFGL
ncbi:hypothetical protein [cyanobacterium endosymbiont of Epithemia clementina EcSB]|nr:hypothetical protein [cyanobacterium endosymbiont of Epithemia clementina EcSB]WGT67086.1 hypothetical protein P3F56_07585 [cyanobacterium endosymbiont of Epithemia clementina EcSB]